MTPSARNSTDSANAGPATPARPKNPTNAIWLVPRPLTLMGSSITRE